MRTTVIVVPCYNEAARLDTAAFEAFVAENTDEAILFVDDGSSDRTREVVSRLAAAHPGAVDVHALDRNSGKAEAVRTGVVQALASGAKRVGYWDADLSTPLDQVVHFGRILDEDERRLCVMGSRVRRLGADVRRNPARHYLGRIFATLASYVLGMGVYDTQCGAKLFRVTEETARIFRAPFLSRWIFDVELLARLRKELGAAGIAVEQTVYESPLPKWEDVGGSKLRRSQMFVALGDLWRIYRAYSS